MKLIFLFFLMAMPARAAEISVGSKAFTEGYVLGELTAETLEDAGHAVERKLGLGATGIMFAALQAGDVDLYPEYTGTIANEMLKNPALKTRADLESALGPLGLTLSGPLGFENNYALAVPREFARDHNLETISDLKRVRQFLKPGFSHEFISRKDGFRPLVKAYRLEIPAPQVMDHALVYRAVASGSVNLVDVYSTDAKIQTLELKVLRDDLNYFTRYEAVILARLSFVRKNPRAWEAIRKLEGTIKNDRMIELNSDVDEEGKSFREAVRGYLSKSEETTSRLSSMGKRIWARTKEHLVLVGIALFFSFLAGVPLGILSAHRPRLGQGILLVSGMLQTIPSLALLCFLIPLFGIGLGSALVALFLYGLLPVVTNTLVGLRSIDPLLKDMSKALGLSWWQALWRIELPLASEAILSGLRTSAVISIGTATLAALIGAGGYGAIIVAGLAINDTGTILLGAAPAAIMALAVQGVFELLEKWIVPKGLR
jgi:osmoprotectant transport system permease protein